MIRLLRGLVAVAALFTIHSTARAVDYTQVPWGVRLGVTPAALCYTTGGDACLAQIGTIRPSTGIFTPLSPNVAYALNSSGIVCDGTTDANAGGAMLTAASAAAAARQKFYLPPFSDCHIKTYFPVPSNADWEGFGTTISLDAAITTGGTLGVGMSLENVSNVHWNGITFSGPGSASLNTNARIGGVGLSNSSITNSTFQNFGTQTAFTGTLTSGSNVITSVSSIAGLKVGMNVNLNNAIIGAISSIGATTVTMSANATTNGASSLIANFYAQGFFSFTPTNVTVSNSTFQNNSGDGLAFSNNVQGTRILNNRFTNNQDSGFVLCTIGGSDNQALGNTVSAPLTHVNPPIVSERCQNSVISYNTVNSGPGSAAIRIARYGDTAEYNQDIKIIGNTVTGGGNISVESSGYNQGSVSVPFGGNFAVSDNHIISPSGAGVAIIDSTAGAVTGNVVTNAGGEGIVEESFVAAVGNNTITGNVLDGATYCLRQVNAGGSISKSEYTGNWVANCSVTATQFVSADYFDRGSISGSAPAGLLSGTTLASNVTGSSLTGFGNSPNLITPILRGGFASLSGNTSGTLFLGWPDIASGTMSFQNGTDTIVARATTDTLTNKTISGASNTLSNLALSSLDSEATNTVVGNATSGSASPTALSVGSCSTASSALIWTTNTGFGCNTSIAASVANPTASVGLSAVNGTATTAMRSDAAPPLSQSISPTWTGTHTFTNSLLKLLGSSTGATTFTSDNAGASNFTAHVPAANDTFAMLAATQALTNKDLTGAGNTFPTFNQNTTGSAAKWTTARNLAGNSVDGSANVAFANKFIVQGTADTGLSAAQFLGALGTCILKNTTTTGVLSCTTAGTDYLTSVGLSFTGGLISVGSSPLTANGTIALTVAGTSGGIPYFASSSTWASSGALTANGVVYGGGAGAAPASTAAGTSSQVLLGGTPPSFGSVPAAAMPALTGTCTTSAGAVATTCTQDGAWTTYTPTITGQPTGGCPTNCTIANSKYKQIGSKTYVLLIDYTVSNVTGGSNSPSFSLPNSTTSTSNFACSMVDTSAGSVSGYAYTSGGNVNSGLGTLATHHYTISCTYETT